MKLEYDCREGTGILGTNGGGIFDCFSPKKRRKVGYDASDNCEQKLFAYEISLTTIGNDLSPRGIFELPYRRFTSGFVHKDDCYYNQIKLKPKTVCLNRNICL